MDFIFLSSFPKKKKNLREASFKLSGEAYVAITFDQRYPAFLVGHSTRDMDIRTLLTVFSIIYKRSRAETFWTCHDLNRALKNSSIQPLAEIFLDLQGILQSLTRTLLESSYDFIKTLLIHTNAETIILLYQRFSEKNILSILPDHMSHFFDDLYWAHILSRDKLGYSTLDKTAAILWATLQSHKVIE